ncbi:MAG: hypothetical protein U0X76_06725 [Bacteroidia bacterium]
MKKIKWLFILLLIAGSSFAQQRQRGNFPPQERAKHRAQMLKAKLGLTDTQYQTIYTQLLKNEEDMDRARAEMKRLRDENDQVLKNTLTPDQYAKLKSMQEERKNMRRERNQGPPDDSDVNPVEEPKK